MRNDGSVVVVVVVEKTVMYMLPPKSQSVSKGILSRCKVSVRGYCLAARCQSVMGYCLAARCQ